MQFHRQNFKGGFIGLFRLAIHTENYEF